MKDFWNYKMASTTLFGNHLVNSLWVIGMFLLIWVLRCPDCYHVIGLGAGPAWSGSERGSLAVSKPRHLRTRALPSTGPARPGEETRAALAEQTEWTVVSQRFINKLWACLCILASFWYMCISIRILVCLLVDTAQVKLFESVLLPFHLLLAPTQLLSGAI